MSDTAKDIVDKIEHGDDEHRRWLHEHAAPIIAAALRAEYVRGLENGLMYAEAGALDELRAEIERAERGDG